MSIRVRILSTALTLALALSFSVEQAAAQAMVSYGHGVAEAAGAGAAVGGGVGGILTGLQNPLSRAADRRGGAAGSNVAAVRRATVPTRRDSVHWDVPQKGFGGPAPLPLVGGVQATGVSEANWQPSLLEPSQNLAVISASWGGASDAESADSEEVAAIEEVAAEVETSAGEQQKATVLLGSVKQARSSGAKSPAARPGVVASSAVPEGIAVGAAVEDLLKKLGRPYLSFRGVAGEGYTDQYVFELPDGGHLVVYVLDGVVTHFDVA